jgi:hypothetical protein
MMPRNDFTGQMVANLKLWSTQIAEIQTRVDESGSWPHGKLKDVLAALRLQQSAYQRHMGTLRNAGDEFLPDLQRDSDRMAAEFAWSYAQVSRRFDA